MKNILVLLTICLFSFNVLAFSRGPFICKGDLTLRSVVKDKPKEFKEGVNEIDPEVYYNLEVLNKNKVVGILLPQDGIHFVSKDDSIVYQTDNENYISISLKTDSKKGSLACSF